MTTDVKQIAAKAANSWGQAVGGNICGLSDIIESALAAYASDYCDSILYVLADIRQKTGVGDKPMLDELADAIVANKKAYGYEMAKKIQERCAKTIEPSCPQKDWTEYAYDNAALARMIRALPIDEVTP